jgi:hypothetical protein
MSNEVRLSKETIDILKSLYAINQTLKIVEDNTELKVLNDAKTIAVYAQIEESLPRTFCIYDLREFISVLNIIEKPILDFSSDKYVVIKSEDGSQRLKYIDCNENLVTSYFDRDFKLPSEDISVSVTAQQMKAIMGAALTMKLEYVGFKSDGEKVYLSAFDRNNGSGDDTNGFSIEVGESVDEFDMFYKTEALTVLDGDCTFEISSNKISKVTNGKKVFWMALDANSSFG